MEVPALAGGYAGGAGLVTRDSAGRRLGEVPRKVDGKPRCPGKLFFRTRVAPVAAALLLTVLCSACWVRRPPRLPEKNAGANEIEALNRKIAAAVTAAKRDYTIGAEDLLEVTLFDIQGAGGEPRVVKSRVSASGLITLPLVGQVQAAGLTTSELETSLREKFRRFIHDPQITVFVEEYRSYRVSVVGYVEKPGVLEVSGDKTLLEVLAMAGGLNKDAGRTVQLTRNVGGEVRTAIIDLDRLSRKGDISLNVTMLPGDVVNVPKAGVFYVEGSVRKPGAYPLIDTVTVTQALATAGGIDPRLGKAGGTTLYRRSKGGEREIIHVDIDAIRKGRAEDILVKEDDVLVVPMSSVKFVVDRFIGSIGMGLAIPAY